MPLLPSGLQDALPPIAQKDRFITNRLLDRFHLFGYTLVSPPLLEFEESLLAGKGKAHEHNTFRVMDPQSQRMMGLRSDITPQIERIATRMLCATTPIVRLSYAGHILRVSPHGLCNKRQLRQTGIEMIGYHQHVQAREILIALIESLQTLEMESLTVSLSIAGIFETLLSGCMSTSQEVIRKAVYHKDIGSLPESMPYKGLIAALLTAPLEQVVEKHDIPMIINAQIKSILEVASHLRSIFSRGVTVLIDTLDTEGFDYHDGLCFTIMDNHSRQEVGRGGCYALTDDVSGCGGTLYIDRLIEADIPCKPTQTEQHVSHSMDYHTTKKLRDTGIMTLYT